MRTLSLLSILAATYITFAQSKHQMYVGAELMFPSAGEVISTPNPQVDSFSPRSTPVWEDNFDDELNWIPEGPNGSDGENYGWSIGNQTNSWYAPIDGDMGTSGSFARFRNGTNINYLQNGPFTLTYSGTIDLTGVENPFIEFSQYGARFRTLQAIQISLDGIEWTTVGTNDDLPITNSFAQHIYPKPLLKRIRLTPFLIGDLTTVQIRFYWDGQMNGTNMNYLDYGWYVDDVKIRPGYEHDLSLNYVTTHFMGVHGHAYSIVPFQANSQNIQFKASITNNGNTVENAYLQVYNGSSFDQNSIDTMLYPGQTVVLDLASSLNFPVYTNPTSINFKAKSNNVLLFEDDDNQNYSFSRAPFDGEFMAVDRYNGQSNSMTGGFVGWPNGTGTQGIGAFFEKLGGFGGAVSHVEIGIANVPEFQQSNYIGNSVYAEIWGYNDDEFVFYGTTSSHVIQAQNFGSTVFLSVDNIEQCISTSGERFLILACFEANALVPIAYSGLTLFESVLGRNGNQFNLLAPIYEGSVFSNAPVVRPYFICPLSLVDAQEDTNQLTIYPNPTDETTTLSFTLGHDENVVIVIRDLTGKTIQTINTGQLTVGAHSITMNLEGMAQGMYTVTLSAGTSTITQKLIVK